MAWSMSVFSKHNGPGQSFKLSSRGLPGSSSPLSYPTDSCDRFPYSLDILWSLGAIRPFKPDSDVGSATKVVTDTASQEEAKSYVCTSSAVLSGLHIGPSPKG